MMWLRPQGWAELKTPARAEVLPGQLVRGAGMKESGWEGETSDSQGAEATDHELDSQQPQQLMPVGPW